MKKGRSSGYYSDDDDSDEESRKKKRYDLAVKDRSSRPRPSKEYLADTGAREEGWKQRFIMSGLDAYGRHKQLVNTYLLYYPGATSILQRDTSRDRTDMDVIAENHRFLWDEDEETSEVDMAWGKRLAKRYYDKLFREYCICDLSRYKENKVAMRWRVESEVVDGKGQFACGAKGCAERQGLRSWEVNFAYVEHGEKKNALVKLRLCPDCSYKLNYRHRRKEVKKKKDLIELSKADEPSSSSTPSASEATPAKDQEQKGGEDETKDEAIWKEPAAPVVEQTRDSQFEEYLQDLLL